jgi:hypothetical protein
MGGARWRRTPVIPRAIRRFKRPGKKLQEDLATLQMNQFLAQVSQAHPDEFIVMVVDGASSHRSQELRVPENILLHRLPGYAPELNPQEHVWDELARSESMDAVVGQLEAGLPQMAAHTQACEA